MVALFTLVEHEIGVLTLIFLLSAFFLNSCYSLENISNNDVNHAPIILSEPVTIAYLDEEYNYDVNAIDEDGDNLVYELTNSPEGMSIDINSGEIFWVPQTGQIGEHDVVISVDDGELSAIQSFTIVIQENNSQNYLPYTQEYKIVTKNIRAVVNSTNQKKAESRDT